MKNNFEEFKKIINLELDKNDFILDSHEIDFYKYHRLFINLDLSEEEIYKNIIYLKRIIFEEENCPKFIDSCVNPFNMHLNLKRHMGKIYICYKPCEKINKLLLDTQYKNLFLYNYYENSDISQASITPESIEINKNPTKLLAAKMFNDNFKNNSHIGMYLYGECGVGKTFMTFAFAKAYAKKQNKTISFIYMPEFVNIIKLGFNNADQGRGNHIYEIAKTCDVLVLDDLGSEYATDWFYSNYLLNILNIRSIQKKITMFTSNFSIDKLKQNIIKKCKNNDAELICERIIDRIRQLVNNCFIEIVGKNLRYK